MYIFDEMTKTFSFLTERFGFELTKKEKSRQYKGEYLVVYRNLASEVQLAFSADNSWFHCIITRLINGQPAIYSDKKNSIGFEDLAMLESNNNYNHNDYIVTGNGLETVLKRTSDLLKRHQKMLTTTDWIDTDQIEKLRTKEFFEKFGIMPANKDTLSYFEEIKKQAGAFLTSKGFSLIFDSNEQPAYCNNSSTEAIIYNRDNIDIKIGQEDWRDFYYIYYIAVNNSKVFEIDLSESNNQAYQVDITIKELKKLVDMIQ